MRKTAALFIALLLLLALTACGAKEPQTQDTAAPSSAETAAPAEEAAPVEAPDAAAGSGSADDPAEPQQAAEGGALVAYFSATGTTKGVAETLAKAVGGDLYEIVPAEPYSDADLNWHDSSSRTTKEQDDKSVRPQIAGDPPDLNAYTTVYLGFPIWWGEEPRIMDTFVESNDFSGKTMIPFCTSGGSGIGSSGKNMEKLTSGATWLDGKRFGAGAGEDELRAWADGLQ